MKSAIKAILPGAAPWAIAVFVATAATTTSALAADVTVLSAMEPRAFGYQVGDLVPRRIVLQAPAGFVLDESSLPQTANRGKALELRRTSFKASNDSGGRRYQIDLEYQIFLAPREVRTLELPGFQLRFKGQPRPQEVRIEAWPVTVAPLVPVEVSPRRGLGETRPDAPPPPIDTTAERRAMTALGVVAALLLAYLAQVYLGLPWWAARHRPFTTAWSALRALPERATAAQRRSAVQSLHQALNRTAGAVLFEHGVDEFVARQPRFARLRDDLLRFFRGSQREFFATADSLSNAPGAEALDPSWLRDFCRRCRDAERGAA